MSTDTKKEKTTQSVAHDIEAMSRATELVPFLKERHPYVPWTPQAIIRMAAGIGLSELEVMARLNSDEDAGPGIPRQ